MAVGAIVLLIVAVAILAVLAWVALNILPRALAVAKNLLEWALEQGFIGVAAYVACWVFMFPVMVVICLVGGGLNWFAERSFEHQMLAALRQEYDSGMEIGMARPSPPADSNSPRDEIEEMEWEEDDRRYEEAKASLLEHQKERGEFW